MDGEFPTHLEDSASPETCLGNSFFEFGGFHAPMHELESIVYGVVITLRDKQCARSNEGRLPVGPVYEDSAIT